MKGRPHLWNPAHDTCTDCGMTQREHQITYANVPFVDKVYGCYNGVATTCCGWNGGYRWYAGLGAGGKWICKGCGKEKADSALLGSASPWAQSVPQKVCECGAEKTYGEGSGLHAHWCPKFEVYKS